MQRNEIRSLKNVTIELVEFLNANIVRAGIYIDNATKEDINRFVKNLSRLVKDLLASDFFKGFLV